MGMVILYLGVASLSSTPGRGQFESGRGFPEHCPGGVVKQ